MVALESSRPETLTEVTRTMLCGEGGRNRWWDKLQFVVYPNGLSGAVLEHALIDGFTGTLKQERRAVVCLPWVLAWCDVIFDEVCCEGNHVNHANRCNQACAPSWR